MMNSPLTIVALALAFVATTNASKSICMNKDGDGFEQRRCTVEDVTSGSTPGHFAEYDGCNGADLFSDDANPGLPGSGDCGLEHPCMSKSQAKRVLVKFGSGDFCGDYKCGTNLRHPCSEADIMFGMQPIYKSSTKVDESTATLKFQTSSACLFDEKVSAGACTAEDMKQGGLPGKFAEYDGCNGADLFSDDAYPGLPGSGDCGLEHPCMEKSRAEEILATFGSGEFCGDDKCGTNLRHPCEVEDIMVGLRPIYKSTDDAAELISINPSSTPYSMMLALGACVLVVGSAIVSVVKRHSSSSSQEYAPVV